MLLCLRKPLGLCNVIPVPNDNRTDTVCQDQTTSKQQGWNWSVCLVNQNLVTVASCLCCSVLIAVAVVTRTLEMIGSKITPTILFMLKKDLRRSYRKFQFTPINANLPREAQWPFQQPAVSLSSDVSFILIAQD